MRAVKLLEPTDEHFTNPPRLKCSNGGIHGALNLTPAAGAVEYLAYPFMPSSQKPLRYRRLYEEDLQHVEAVLRLLDGILQDTIPMVDLPEGYTKERVRRQFWDAKKTVSILADVLRNTLGRERQL